MAINNKVYINASQGSTANYQTSTFPIELAEVNISASIMYTASNSPLETLATTSPISLTLDQFNNYEDVGLNEVITVSQHSNEVDGMYFVKYDIERSNVNSSFTPCVSFRETTDSFMSITQSLQSEGSLLYNFTGSLDVYKNNNHLLSETFTLSDSSSIDTISEEWIYSGSFNYNDEFKFAISSIDKTPISGLTITSYTSSINPTFSKFAVNPNNSNDLTDNSVGFREAQPLTTTIPNYYGPDVIPFSFAVDCQPLINNAITNRLSAFLQDVDYTNVSGSLIPVNQEQLINFTAVRAAIPDSNYTTTRIINPRYNGSKTSSTKLNIWTPKDRGTYGKLPVIELRNAIFGYFDKIIDPYPNINDKVQLNLTYLIDEQGNALPPNLNDDSISNLDSTFPEGKKARISLNEGSKELKELNNPYDTSIVGSYLAPIMYTQTSSHGYATEIPLTGSGRISMYDDGESAFTNLAFSAQGTPSDAPAPNDSPSSTLSTIFNLPNVNYDTSGGNTSSSFDTGNGKISFDSDISGSSGGTSQDYTIFFETSFATNFLYESGRPEMNVKLSLKNYKNDNDGINIPFNFEDIQLKVYKGDNVINVGSVINDSNDIVRFETKGLSQQKGLNSNNEVEMIFENYAIQSLLISRNLYVNGQGGSDFKGDIDGFEWVIKANTQNYNTKEDDVLQWNLNGTLVSRDDITNVFFPVNYNGPILPTKITMLGSKNHLFASDNLGIFPFWEYSGSNYSFLEMEDSNINEAYGEGYKQGDLEYIPGPSEFFPDGQEPEGTRFDNIKYPIEFYPGDEIRFGNNENYSYVIKRVFPPQENNGKIKIQLNKEVPTSINKDFFLIRRKIKSSNSVLLDATFPYGIPTTASTSPGILYPEFPTELLKTSASLIVEDLVDKGIIK